MSCLYKVSVSSKSWLLICFAVLCLLGEKISCQQIVPATDEQQVPNKPDLKNFDWKAYCQLYPDLPGAGINTELSTKKHFVEFGFSEGRLFPKTVPEEPEYSISLEKLKTYVKFMDDLSMPVRDRTMIVFHIGKLDAKNSVEVILNNLKIYQSAMALDSDGMSDIFYWFNIVDGQDNMLFRSVNTSAFNSALCSWAATPSDIYTHLRTLSLLSETLMQSFGSTFFLNNGVRGPLHYRAKGEWIKPFQQLLFSHNNGIVGSTISCEVAPHVQTHFFGLRNSLIPIVTKEYDAFRTFPTWPALVRYYEVGLTELIQRSGYNISALLYANRLQSGHFYGKCLSAVKFVDDHTVDNPSRWCDITTEEVILYKWGGDMLRTNGFICDQTKTRMKDTLLVLAKEIPSLDIPETLRGGSHYDLFKQFEQEMHREVINNHHFPLGDDMERDRITRKRVSDKVCLLVRTASMHDSQRNTTLMNRDIFDGLDNFIDSLERQTDEHWDAFFFITDHKPFTSRLKEILTSHNDSRLTFLHINRKFRKAYSKEDAGYTATDIAMRKMLQRTDCQWVSATNADNIYGSEVIERIRKAGHADPSTDMILIPIDSRNFMYQDLQNRKLIRHWDQMCVSLASMVEINLLAFTTQPRPIVGRVDLAGVFFSRPRLAAENIYFGNFTHKHKYPCTGCQDGYFTEYLTTHRGWKYTKLPIDGLKSILFHGPSPLWCVAAGHVWFSHPDVNKVKCYSQRTVDSIRSVDNKENTVFDWYYFDKNDRMCLRLTAYGYDRRERLG